MGCGSQSVQSTSGPPQQFLDAFSNVYGRAQGVANSPLNLFPQGPQATAANPFAGVPSWMVAQLTPNQKAAIGSAGPNNPFIQNASSSIGASTNQLLPQIPTYSNAQVQGNVAGGLGQIATANGGFANIPTWQGQNSISPYMSPYTQDVVNATQAQFANNNAQQQQQVIGNAASSGAWGGDRSAVAQAVLGGQQQTAQAPVIAGLYDKGFGQALGEFNTQQGLGNQMAVEQAQTQLGQGQQLLGFGQQQQQTELGALEANAWLNSQAGFGYANLGQESLGQQLQTGSLAQQQKQANKNVPYEEWQAQQAYPFQTTGWLSNIAEGLGGASGGTSSTTYPGPSALSSIGGLGLAGAGVLGATGAFGSSGWLTGGGGGVGLDNIGSVSTVARGGRIPHRAGGGATPPMGFGIPTVGSGLAGSMESYVPSGPAPGAGGSGGFVHQALMQPNTTQSGGGSSASSGLGDVAALASIAKFALPLLARGGIVHRAPGGPVPSPAMTYAAMMRPRGYDDGGSIPYRGVTIDQAGNPVPIPDSDLGLAAHPDPGFGAGTPPMGLAGGPYGASLASGRLFGGQGAIGAQSGQGVLPPNAGPASLAATEAAPAGVNLGNPNAATTPLVTDRGDQFNLQTPGAKPLGLAVPPASPLLDYVPKPPAPASAATAEPTFAKQPMPGGLGSPPGATPTPLAPQSEIETAPHHRELNPWLALMAAGFGMMAGKSPWAGPNIGAGGLAGVQNMMEQRQENIKADERDLQMKQLGEYRQDRIASQQQGHAVTAQGIMERAETARQAQAERARHDQEMESFQQQIAAGTLTQAGTDENGNAVAFNNRTGKYITGPKLFPKPADQARIDQGDRRLDQTDRRLDQGDIRQDALTNYRTQNLAIRQGMAGLAQQKFGVSLTSAQTDEAIKLMLAQPGLKPEDALPQVLKMRGQAAPPPGQAAPAAAPQGAPAPSHTAVNPQTGERLQWNGTSWVPFAATPQVPTSP